MATTAASSLDDITNHDLRHWVNLIKQIRAAVDAAIVKERAQGIDISQQVLNDYPFIKTPASQESIQQQESTLQTTLPEDYKQFLHVTNGTGFSGISWIPSLRGVEQLQWTQAADEGLGLLRLDTFPPNVTSLEETTSLTSEEFDESPPLERILMIGDEDEETVVLLLEPEYVRKCWVWLAGKRGMEVGDAPGQWLLISFTPWMATVEVHPSFEEYMRSRIKSVEA
ncbi:hypothetical protein BBK36DRAFT_1143856 [Trichoderma citrinoviride]|uniref:Knr4/Smi1-like domain-containing protein n=1 Tax=Trichoderma citrinoviride TaxID=58853 RepID=A0A2T4B2C5_9HYPO|nr:hypothetical protein BBK36DRAFT_1143856 [Trichoderma citrinoviride]PTB63361.1 hypothetical protein BBK36DRAFT_1143856 [Trichoderma citrinoviride]